MSCMELHEAHRPSYHYIKLYPAKGIYGSLRCSYVLYIKIQGRFEADATEQGLLPFGS